MQLRDLARVVRSKNAGPRTMTLDVIFESGADFEHAIGSARLTPAAIGALYDLAPALIRVIPYPVCHAIKITMPRRVTAGDPGDSDVYGAQQHGRLCEIEL